MNQVYIKFPAIPENERLSRMMVAAFLADMDPTLEELDDIRTAVSEAVTNSIIHAYDEQGGEVELICIRKEKLFEIQVADFGRGIEDVEQAMEPLFTTRPLEERSGMGFSFMEAFMDRVEVVSAPGEGTRVIMKKNIGSQEE